MRGRHHRRIWLARRVGLLLCFLVVKAAFATSLSRPIDTNFPDIREGRPVYPPGLTDAEQHYLQNAPLDEALRFAQSYDYYYSKEDYSRTKMLEAYLVYLSRITDLPTSTTPIENHYTTDTMNLEWHVSRYCRRLAGGPGEVAWPKEHAAVLSRFVRHCPKSDERYVLAHYDLAMSFALLADATSCVEVANRIAELKPKDLHPFAAGQWKRTYKRKAENLIIDGLTAGQNEIQAIVNLRTFMKRAKGVRLKSLIKKKLEEFEEVYLHEIAEIEQGILTREAK